LIASRENIRLQKIILTISIVLFAVKITAWYLTKSLAVLTDALESIVNMASASLGTYSLYLSSKPRDADHPYGHGKVEFLSAAVEGTLVSVAGIIIIYKSAVSFFYPHQIMKLDYGMILLAATAVINYVAGVICVSTGRKNSSLLLVASGKHLKTDTYSTIAILIGLMIVYFTNAVWLDSVVACVFGFIIIFTGYTIIRESIAGIMDEADIKLLNNLVELLNKNRRENWIDLHNLRFIKYGSTLHCDCHLTVPWYLNVNEAHEEVEALAKLIRNEFGEAVELFVHTDGCQEFSCKICYKQNCAVRQHPFEKKITWTVKNISKDSRHKIFTQSE
jgi:cation diffusion facilitator family transporter